MASDLIALIKLLTKVGINYDPGELSSILSELNNNTYIPGCKEFSATNNTWGYNCNNICFELDSIPDGIQPKVTCLKIFLKINLIALYEKRPEIINIKLLENNIVVRGYKDDDEYISTYHIDKHVDGAGEPEYPHPSFHFHYGGKEMKVDTANYNYGSLLLLDSPRIVCLPMDIFLTIDFILSNFMPDKWRKLRRDGEYVNLYRKYQKYFWRPFIYSLYKHWDNSNMDEETNITDSMSLLPQLVPCRES